jgi:hypothetical protein
MKILLFVIILFCLNACNSGGQESVSPSTIKESKAAIFSNDTLINLYLISLTIPKAWKLANDDTLPKVPDATIRFRLHNRNGKLVYIEHGFSTNSDISEPNVMPARFRVGYQRNQTGTSDIIFSDNPRLTELRKQWAYSYTFEEIDGHRAKHSNQKNLGKATQVFILTV